MRLFFSTILLIITLQLPLTGGIFAAESPTVPPMVVIQVQGVITEVFIGSQPLKSGLVQQLCITFVETADQQTIGLVENYDDCFWSLTYKERIGELVSLSEIAASSILDSELLEALYSFREDARYILSEPY
jgi:hypothetical protein